MTKQSRFRYTATLQTVATGMERNLDKAVLARLSECRWVNTGRIILISGPTGAGESYLASALGRHFCFQGYRTRY